MAEFSAVVFTAIIIGLYFLPWVISVIFGHKDRNAILLLNIFLGWTLVGWVIALVWSVKKN